MEKTIIDTMYEEFKELLLLLDEGKEISLRSMVDNTFKKTLAVSAASFFEHEIRRILLEFVALQSSNNELISNFIKNKAIERQYHSYFAWETNNANKFFGLFGQSFRDSAKSDVSVDDNLAESIKSFLQLGDLRNQLAHLNFAQIILNKTADEVYLQYKNALIFIKYFENKLLQYNLT